MALKRSDRSYLNSFMVMDVMAKAAELEQMDRSIMHLEVGQPSTGAPKAASEAIIAALSDPATHGYTLSTGMTPLRQGIAQHYKRWYDLDIDPVRIMVTVGSSMGFAMAFLTCFDVGDRVAMTNPGYSAYRNLMKSVGLETVDLPARAEQDWVPRLEDLEALSPGLMA